MTSKALRLATFQFASTNLVIVGHIRETQKTSPD